MSGKSVICWHSTSCSGCGICPHCHPEHDCQQCDRERNPSKYELEDHPVLRMMRNASDAGFPVGSIQVVEAESAFIYGERDYDATAYVISRASGYGSTSVKHQYGGACCDKAEFDDVRLFALAGDFAAELDRLLGPQPYERADEIESLVRLVCPDATVRVWGEAMLAVRSEMYGDFYIATNNSD